MAKIYAVWPRVRERDAYGYARTVLANHVIDRWRRPIREQPEHELPDTSGNGDFVTSVAECQGSDRGSIAGLIRLKPGHRTRLIYRTIARHGRRNEPKGFRENDYAALLHTAHQQLGGPVVLVWDNLTAHHDAAMRALIETRAWLTVFRFPTYASELNPVEACSHTSSAAWATSPPAASISSPPW